MRSRVLVAAGLAALTAMAVACGTPDTPAAVVAPSQDAGTAPAADANILVVGMDAGPGREGSRPDTMVLVHVPKSGDSAAFVSLPRDLWVNGGKDFGQVKLNAVYSLGLAAEKRKAPGLPQRQLVQKAQEDLVRVVQDVTGVTIDHYAQTDMRGFADLSKVVGGVDVCLVNAVHDPNSGANFPAGLQKVQGDAALAFVRQRHGLPNGDLDRVRRQQAFLTGLVTTVSNSGVLSSPAKVRALLDAVRKYVVLDQRWDLVSFAKQVRGLNSAAVRTATVPVTGTNTQGSLTIDPAAVKGFVHSFFAARPSKSDSQTMPPPPPAGGGAAAVCVN